MLCCFHLLDLFFKLIFILFRDRKSIIVENLLLKQQLEIKNRVKTDVRSKC